MRIDCSGINYFGVVACLKANAIRERNNFNNYIYTNRVSRCSIASDHTSIDSSINDTDVFIGDAARLKPNNTTLNASINTSPVTPQPEISDSTYEGVMEPDTTLNRSGTTDNSLINNGMNPVARLSTYTSTKLSDYTSAKFINITGGGVNLTNYQIMFILHKGNETDSGKQIYLNNYSQNWVDNPEDIRFTNIDGYLLDYWVESSNETQATVWVEVDSIPTYGCNIMLFYGSNESSMSNGDETFQFFDTFDSINTQKWEFSDGCTLGDNELIIQTTDSTNKKIKSQYLFGTGYAVRARIKSGHFNSISYSERFGFQNNSGNLAGSIADYCDNDMNDKGKYRNRLISEAMSRLTINGWTGGQYGIQEIQRYSNQATYIIKDNSNTRVNLSTNYYTGKTNIMVDTKFNGASITLDWVLIRNCSSAEPGYGPITQAFSPDMHTIGVYAINYYGGTMNLGQSINSAMDLYNKITALEGWQGSWVVTDEDVKPVMFSTENGTEYRRVDYVDLAYFAGHGYDGNIILHYNPEVDWLPSTDCSWGNKHLKWIGLQGCLCLSDYEENFSISMNGVHEVMGFTTIAHDGQPTPGDIWSMYMTGPNPAGPNPLTIREAWLHTGQMCMPYGTGIRVFYAEGCQDDYLYGIGQVSSNPDENTLINNTTWFSINTSIQ